MASGLQGKSIAEMSFACARKCQASLQKCELVFNLRKIYDVSSTSWLEMVLGKEYNMKQVLSSPL